MHKSEIIQRIINPGIIAVIRADSSDQLVDLAQALLDGGVTSMEVTMTTPNALEVIKEVTDKFGSKITMGVGTVLDAITARLAILAGAQFVVTPVFRADVIELCNRYSKPIISGAYTPTEALIAHEAGADFIKIFPAEGLGPNYISALKAPLPQLQIIPTGGVDVKTCGDFIRAGCAAVAAGSTLISKDILKQKDWSTLTVTAKTFVNAVATTREKMALAN
jgi:2-dehydro-3-deoxyphosphogluconate aldolase/(4S)-4-hydroxy-2-oxoglutarate aldolase